MKNIKNFLDKKPITGCIITEIIFLIIFLIINFIIERLSIDTDIYNVYMSKEFIMTIISFSFMCIWEKVYILKRNLRIKRYFGGLLTGIFILIAGSLTLFSGWMEIAFKDVYMQVGIETTNYILQPKMHILVFVLYIILIGIAEEILFRGIIAEELLKVFGTSKKGIVKAIMISSIMFGIAHMINALNTSVLSAVIQTIIVSFMGMVFSIIYFKSGNIWTVITVHAFIDFSQLAFNGGIYGNLTGKNTMADAMEYSLLNLLGIIPYIILLFILLRKKNIKIIQENYKD